MEMTRYGMMIYLRPEYLQSYKEFHASVWPDVLRMIANCNIRNYTIFHFNGVLFGYYEYHGTDHAADMAKMAADPTTQRWWEIMMPMQKQVEGTPDGDWWMPMNQVFHFDGDSSPQ
jgi:L-rhamnose mutarotase